MDNLKKKSHFWAGQAGQPLGMGWFAPKQAVPNGPAVPPTLGPARTMAQAVPLTRLGRPGPFNISKSISISMSEDTYRTQLPCLAVLIFEDTYRAHHTIHHNPSYLSQCTQSERWLSQYPKILWVLTSHHHIPSIIHLVGVL